MDFLADFDQINKPGPEDRNYLNAFPGNHTLQVERFERSKTGRAVVLELKNSEGELFTHLFQLDAKLEWQRERTIRELREFAGAATGRKPKDVTLDSLFSGVKGSFVCAAVAPNKRGFNTVKFSAP